MASGQQLNNFRNIIIPELDEEETVSIELTKEISVDITNAEDIGVHIASIDCVTKWGYMHVSAEGDFVIENHVSGEAGLSDYTIGIVNDFAQIHGLRIGFL